MIGTIVMRYLQIDKQINRQKYWHVLLLIPNYIIEINVKIFGMPEMLDKHRTGAENLQSVSRECMRIVSFFLYSMPETSLYKMCQQ